MNAKALKSLEHCTLACKKTIQEMQLLQQKEMIQIIATHAKALEKVGGGKVVRSVMKRDTISALVELNTFLKAKDTKRVLVAILKDMAALYKTRRPYIDQVIHCYIQHCDETALAIIKGVLEAVVNMILLLGDKEIETYVKSIRKDMAANAQYAIKLLQAKH